jgi:hypothetical protein
MEQDEAPFAEDARWNDTDLFAADFTPASLGPRDRVASVLWYLW